MTRKHYHVLTGMRGGYMPDDNAYCATLAEARQCAKSAADSYRDEWEDDKPIYRVSGNMRDGYEVMPRDADEHTLGYYIQINECSEPDCSADEEY